MTSRRIKPSLFSKITNRLALIGGNVFMIDKEFVVKARQWIVAASIHGGKHGILPDRLAAVIRMDLQEAHEIASRLIADGFLDRGKRGRLLITARGRERAKEVKSFGPNGSLL